MGPPNEWGREEGASVVYHPNYSFCLRKIVRKLQVPFVQSTVFFQIGSESKIQVFLHCMGRELKAVLRFFHMIWFAGCISKLQVLLYHKVFWEQIRITTFLTF